MHGMIELVSFLESINVGSGGYGRILHIFYMTSVVFALVGLTAYCTFHILYFAFTGKGPIPKILFGTRDIFRGGAFRPLTVFGV